MKIHRSISTGIKTLVLTVLISLIGSLDADLKAQSSKVGAGLVGAAALKKDDYNAISSFSPVYNGGKTYIRWLVSNDEKDGIFIVERSADGVDFEALGFKDRVGSPLCVNLFYSYIDEEPIAGANYYRVMSVGTDQTYTYSDVVRVRTDVASPASQPNSANLETDK